MYNFTGRKSGYRYDNIYGYLLLRPDLEQGARMTCEKSGSTERCNGGKLRVYYPLSSYQYSLDFKPVSDLDYHCFYTEFNNKKDAAMLFSKDGNMNLLGEWFTYGSKSYLTTFTFLYDSVQEYVHNTVDHEFSLDGEGTEWATDAPDALTRLCENVHSDSPSDSASSFVIPSLVSLIASVIAYILF